MIATCPAGMAVTAGRRSRAAGNRGKNLSQIAKPTEIVTNAREAVCGWPWIGGVGMETTNLACDPHEVALYDFSFAASVNRFYRSGQDQSYQPCYLG